MDVAKGAKPRERRPCCSLLHTAFTPAAISNQTRSRDSSSCVETNTATQYVCLCVISAKKERERERETGAFRPWASYLGEVAGGLDVVPLLLGHDIDDLLLAALLSLGQLLLRHARAKEREKREECERQEGHRFV